MNYSVLLVDDESIDLEWLSRRIAQRHERLDIAAAVNSAFEALRILRETSVDMMITDIRMPIMTGLELASKARELRPELQIVFVSGHEEFEYAKQAIKVSAHAYLLKPVDDRELRETLDAMTAKLDAERRSAETGRQLRETLPLVEKELVLGWLEGASPELESYAAARLRPPPESDGLICAVLEIDDVERRLGRLAGEERSASLQAVFRSVEAWCEEAGMLYGIRDKRHRFVLIAACGEARLAELAAGWISRIRDDFAPLTATVAVGGAARGASGLQASFRQAESALREKLFLGNNRLIRPSDGRERAVPPEADFESAASAMYEDMLRYRLVAVDERLEALFRQLDRYGDKTAIVHFIVHFMTRLHMHGERRNENLFELLDWQYGSLGELERFETVHDMKSWLRKSLFELSELLYTKQQKQNRKLIDSILAFIGAELEDKMTLRKVADRFGFSPNYLGQLFKEETGEHFNDYLTRARMERACELLQEPTLKIYEVADKVGYKNSLYFNRQFKQQFGLTPGEFRKANKI